MQEKTFAHLNGSGDRRRTDWSGARPERMKGPAPRHEAHVITERKASAHPPAATFPDPLPPAIRLQIATRIDHRSALTALVLDDGAVLLKRA